MQAVALVLQVLQCLQGTRCCCCREASVLHALSLALHLRLLLWRHGLKHAHRVLDLHTKLPVSLVHAAWSLQERSQLYGTVRGQTRDC